MRPCMASDLVHALAVLQAGLRATLNSPKKPIAKWCSYGISPADGAGPPVYDNDLNLPIITSGTCEDTFGDLGMEEW